MPQKEEIVDPNAVINGYGDEVNSTTDQVDLSSNETESGNGTEGNGTANIPKELL